MKYGFYIFVALFFGIAGYTVGCPDETLAQKIFLCVVACVLGVLSIRDVVRASK